LLYLFIEIKGKVETRKTSHVLATVAVIAARDQLRAASYAKGIKIYIVKRDQLRKSLLVPLNITTVITDVE
jgi:hypothetical protein